MWGGQQGMVKDYSFALFNFWTLSDYRSLTWIVFALGDVRERLWASYGISGEAAARFRVQETQVTRHYFRVQFPLDLPPPQPPLSGLKLGILSSPEARSSPCELLPQFRSGACQGGHLVWSYYLSGRSLTHSCAPCPAHSITA